MSDLTTLSFYDENAEAFCTQTVNVDMSALYQKFLTRIPIGGHILDAGCGSGRDAKAFLDNGFKVSAFDASASLASRASTLIGQEVRCCRFDDITEVEAFDGIWACASLLHVRQSQLQTAVASLAGSLRKGGAFYASFKKGTGERVDANGRHFTDMSLEAIERLIGHTKGLELVEAWETRDQRPGREDELWWNFIASKC